MSSAPPRYKSDMTELEIRQLEEQEFQTGPMSMLTLAVKSNQQVLISLRNNKKLLARVKAFDRHMNMVLENVKEMWTQVPEDTEIIGKEPATKKRKTASAKQQQPKTQKPINKDRFISKMFLRGDSVVLVVRC